MLSTRLVSELGDPRSTLRATTDRSGAAVIISAGGEIDACNERTWRRLVSEAASVVVPPGPFVVDVTGLDFMGCCAFAVLANEAQWCEERGIELRLVSKPADRHANCRRVRAQPSAAHLPDHGGRARDGRSLGRAAWSRYSVTRRYSPIRPTTTMAPRNALGDNRRP